VAVLGDKESVVSGSSGGVTLPQVGPEVATAEALGRAPGEEAEAPGGVPERPEVSSFRLLMTLALAGAIAGALLVFVFQWSDPLIRAEQARVLQEAVTEVLQSPDRFEEVYVLGGEVMAQVPEGASGQPVDTVFLGYDEAGNTIGFAIAGDGFGFQDLIYVIFGYEPAAGELLGMKVLGHKETPGLGDKIVKDSAFVSEFRGLETRWSAEDSLFIRGASSTRSTGDPDEVEMITGVTISSKAVVKIINERIAELGDLLAAYEPGGGEATGTAVGGREEGR
jgi:electron transport complex protein RnfG